MTLLELKQAVASVLGVSVSDLTVNGLDLGLMAANAVRLQAEQLNDFEFQRKLVSLTLDTVTGGSLVNAVLYGTATAANIKTVIDVGQLDQQFNMRPVEWTTAAESLSRMRQDWPTSRSRLRYPTDGEYASMCAAVPRIVFSGDNVNYFPKPETGSSVTLVLETYCYSADWTTLSNTVTLAGSTGATGANTTYFRYGLYNSKPLFLSIDPVGGSPANIYAIWYKTSGWVITLATDIGSEGADYFSLTSTSQSPAGTYTNHGAWGGTAAVTSADADATSDIWLTKGFNYMLWASVVWLNQSDNDVFGKRFVGRTEGNLAPPQQMADAALAAFITNDSSKFELFRTHGR